MVIYPASIHDFIEPAPVCLQSATSAEVIELLGRYHADRLVFVDERQSPIGVIHAYALLSRVGQAEECDLEFLIEPLPTIVDTTDLLGLEFSSPIRYWAAVNAAHQFLGLVDSVVLRTWSEFLQSEPIKPKVSSESLWHRAKAETCAELERSRLKLSPTMNQLQQQIQTQTAKLGYELVDCSIRFDAVAEPDSNATLMQFLDHLPLPLMLQTQTGEVIAQNKVWAEQLGDILDPNWVQRDAATILELAAPAVQSSTRSAPVVASVTANLCQKGSAPNTCICVCPLKNGQERVLQFAKIPLGELFSHQHIPAVDSDSAFRLAAFEQGTAHSDRSQGPTQESVWLVLAQDITEQQQLSRELAAKNADLIQLNRLKDEFLACISHELRTPLTAVLGLSSLLKDQLSGTLNERQIRYAQLIHRSGRHLMAIVNDILDLTRIETGQLELTFYSVSLKSLCDRVIEQAQQVCLEEEKPETRTVLDAIGALPACTLEIEPGLEALVADELRLRQMLVHLLSNALKFTDISGKIGLKVSRWEGWIAFTVWDTGIGIPSEKQHLIFQKFQQLENPMTRRFEGAGLGLVLTQRLARLHGGDVSFVSKEDQGSEFTLLLPPTHPHPTDRIAVSRPKSSSNRLVLVVEAVVKSIELLSEQLAELGYRVVIARSGTEAIEKARRLQPCAMFINPLLPTLSGWDVLTLLKAEPETREIPVIVTGTRGDRDQAYRNQADGFVALPIVQKALQQVLNQLTPDEVSVPPIVEPLPQSIVILRLSPTRYGELHRLGNRSGIDLNALLHSQNYRVVEADDLEQAELLAQVWKPNIVLLDAAVSDPIGYLKLLGDCSFLASLPLVTLDPVTAQAANQVPGLTVFPCLAPVDESAESSALLQVIQVAAGFAWRPFVLAINSAKLRSPEAKRSDWLQAVMQYFQTAGFRGMIARSWQDVLQKLDTQSIDLLLLHALDLDQSTIEQLSPLKRFREKVAIVVINHQPENTPLLEAIATVVLPPMPMEDLLNRVNSILTK
ncbi:ATP-binding protein [Leptolyngbya sp. FACHB-17]|uniref:ATP-binding response regulator n=1 Tax=unclassified Leptolyngbya TaxID=2650499 RepID=UPI0016800438|nr:ATP-binding protein [Leptolyngbya sp. FACHB-17]MBD2080357.1 response regulator [Leptolyngbya sp. FACHB-17]